MLSQAACSRCVFSARCVSTRPDSDRMKRKKSLKNLGAHVRLLGLARNREIIIPVISTERSFTPHSMGILTLSTSSIAGDLTYRETSSSSLPLSLNVRFSNDQCVINADLYSRNEERSITREYSLLGPVHSRSFWSSCCLLLLFLARLLSRTLVQRLVPRTTPGCWSRSICVATRHDE